MAEEASQVATSAVAAQAAVAQVQVGDTSSNDTTKNSERHICYSLFFCYPKSVIRLSHTYTHRASQFVFCKEISNLNSVIGRIITK